MLLFCKLSACSSLLRSLLAFLQRSPNVWIRGFRHVLQRLDSLNCLHVDIYILLYRTLTYMRSYGCSAGPLKLNEVRSL